MRSESGGLIEVRRVQYFSDLPKRKPEFPVEEYLLQSKQFFTPIIPVPVTPYMCWFEQTDFVVIMQGANGHARKLCKLFHGVVAQSIISRRSGRNLDPHAT